MSELTYINDPIKFLKESGLLFEINRQVLHPFGLELKMPEETSGPGEVAEFRIWDERKDKEGIVYAPDAFVHGMEKLNTFLEEFGLNKLEERKEELGYVTQEYPDPHMKANGVSLITYNPEYDVDNADSHDLVVFKVPYPWLEKASKQWFGYGVDELLDGYTYDNIEPLYHEAKRKGIILQEETLQDAL